MTDIVVATPPNRAVDPKQHIIFGRRRKAPVRRRSQLLWIAPTILLAFTALAGCGQDEEQLVGYQILPAPQIGHLSVDDASHDGANFPIRAQPGGLLVAFLGFTNCPDVCPIAMSEVGQALERLGDDSAPIDVAMLTVDPRRDTPDVLTEYVQQFVENAHALRTEDPAQLQSIVEAFGATYAAEHDVHGDTTDVGHTDYTYLLDDTGQVVLTWTAEMTVDDLVNDLAIMLAER